MGLELTLHIIQSVASVMKTAICKNLFEMANNSGEEDLRAQPGLRLDSNFASNLKQKDTSQSQPVTGSSDTDVRHLLLLVTRNVDGAGENLAVSQRIWRVTE